MECLGWMCRWGRERGDTAEKVGWDGEPFYAMTLKDHGTPIDVPFCIGRLEWKAPDSPRSPSLWEFLKGVPIAAFEKRNPVLSIWSVYTLITLIPMMHLLPVLEILIFAYWEGRERLWPLTIL